MTRWGKMMTRKDYIDAAKRIVGSDYSPAMKKTVALFMAGFFANDNPRFDRQRFFKACGVEE